MQEPSNSKAHELLRYLDSMRAAYPYGIPRSVIVAGTENSEPPGQSTLTTHEGVILVHFIVLAADGSLTAQESALLDSVVSKGLTIPAHAASREIVTTPVEVGERISACVASLTPRVIVVLGDSSPDGRIEQFGSTAVLYSHALPAIASEAVIKKEFWGHLKKIVGGLA